ncbi:hypothetical protein F2Q69_00036035 [Brassica cretica]|uniref:Uncharacterized protein n=1 Tax=Brassica cretica TaxID=69181 RepID=A0A8S9SW65_BRACR|nr:hypothetical protein F2Q69_00036035 [Brassica cretica]
MPTSPKMYLDKHGDSSHQSSRLDPGKNHLVTRACPLVLLLAKAPNGKRAQEKRDLESIASSSRPIVEPKTSGCHHHVLMLRRRGRTSELVGSGTSGASQNISQRHHSVTNIQANNLLGTHDLNTRLRVGNSSVNLYFRHEFKFNLLVIRHEFAVDSLIVRHEFTKTRLWLGMSLQKLSFY